MTSARAGKDAPAIASPAMLANPCAVCHGTNGVSVGTVSSLRGIPAAAFIQVMHEFRAGGRPDVTIMGRIAKGYTDLEIEAMAEFFSTERKD